MEARTYDDMSESLCLRSLIARSPGFRRMPARISRNWHILGTVQGTRVLRTLVPGTWKQYHWPLRIR